MSDFPTREAIVDAMANIIAAEFHQSMNDKRSLRAANSAFDAMLAMLPRCITWLDAGNCYENLEGMRKP